MEPESPGQADGPTPSFYEPGGLALANGNLYVADTNNHAIRVIDLKTKRATTLEAQRSDAAGEEHAGARNCRPAQTPKRSKFRHNGFAPAPNGALQIDVELPAGYHLNPLAPQRYKVSVDGKSIAIDEKVASRMRRKI